MRRVGLVVGREQVAEWQRATRAQPTQPARDDRDGHPDADPHAVRFEPRRDGGWPAGMGRRVGVPAAIIFAVACATLPGLRLQPHPTSFVDGLQAAPAGLNVLAVEDRPRRHSPEGRAEVGPMPIGAAQQAVPQVDMAVASAAANAVLTGQLGTTAPGAMGIPVTVLAAYHRAEQNLLQSDPSCHLPWWVLAGIGRIESGHASGGRVDASGTTRGAILGPRLDGSLADTAVIRDSDVGALDGDPAYDRAVGPMQFLPGTWRGWARDGNGDGETSPHNIFDAATAAGAYLCAGGRDLSNAAGLAGAILSYNHSEPYLSSVLTWGMAYRDGVTPSGDGVGTVPAGESPRQPESPAPVSGLPPALAAPAPSAGSSTGASPAPTWTPSTTRPAATTTTRVATVTNPPRSSTTPTPSSTTTTPPSTTTSASPTSPSTTSPSTTQVPSTTSEPTTTSSQATTATTTTTATCGGATSTTATTTTTTTTATTTMATTTMATATPTTCSRAS